MRDHDPPDTVFVGAYSFDDESHSAEKHYDVEIDPGALHWIDEPRRIGVYKLVGTAVVTNKTEVFIATLPALKPDPDVMEPATPNQE